MNGREKIGIENVKNSKAFIDFSQAIDDVYENVEDYNQTKKRSVLIAFYGMIADMKANKKLKPIVAELFMRRKKINISIIFISKFHFKVPKTIRLNATHYFIMKIPNKREHQQIALNHLSDIEFKDFMKIYKPFTKEPFSILVNDTTLSSDNPLRYRKNML